jgi:uncharacterized protein (UPF0332 family)
MKVKVNICRAMFRSENDFGMQDYKPKKHISVAKIFNRFFVPKNTLRNEPSSCIPAQRKRKTITPHLLLLGQDLFLAG